MRLSRGQAQDHPGSTPTTLTDVAIRDVDATIRGVTKQGRTVVLPFSSALISATRSAATDDRSRVLRVSAAFGLLPLPVVTDVVLLVVAVPLGLFYREPLVALGVAAARDRDRAPATTGAAVDRPGPCDLPQLSSSLWI